MSQTAPAPRPVSRRSSGSPPGLNQTLPAPYTSVPNSNDVRAKSAGLPSQDLERPQHIHIPPRTLGVHSILNPSESRAVATGEGPSKFLPTRDVESSHITPSSAASGNIRPFYPGTSTSGSQPGTPIGSLTPSGPLPNSGRNSPVASYPFTTSNNGRKMLSPKPPRPSSFHQSHLSQDTGTRHLIPSVAPAKRPFEVDVDDDPKHGRLHQHAGQPPGLGPHDANRSRSYSQPISGQHDGGPGVPAGMHARDASIRPQSLHGPPSYHHGPPVSRPTTSAGPMGEGAPPWSEQGQGPRMTSTVVGGDGQQAFMTLPGSDTLIPVQVDYSQASKKADEKRQRNAKASTRHRRKKKTLQEENVKQLQDLRDERQEMSDHADALKLQRDFYRNERNRLRDIIARTPSISQHANGPPSPTSTLSGGSYADRSPTMQVRHMPTSSQGYASETSSVERPAQRRRTDERHDYTAPAYGGPSGGHHHGMPVPGQVYGAPPRPHSAASSANGERLPPLRAMEGPPTGSSAQTGQPHEQDPRTGQWRPVQPRQYETGWATGPRKPPDGHAW